MRKLLLLLTSICFVSLLYAQVSKTVNVASAGTLSTLLTKNEDTTITNLTITGTIDSLDFVTLRMMSQLKVLDLSGVSCPSIPNSAFYNCSDLTSITIPSSVTSIGSEAFLDCSRLTSINIPLSVTSIGFSAFTECSGLTSITFPSSVTSTGDYTFEYCSGLTSISIPSSITSIGSGAFADCSNLTSITIPSSVTSIKNQAFAGCSGLTSITIPSTVTSIRDNAFAECSSLQSIYAYSIVPINISITDVLDDGPSITLPYDSVISTYYVFNGVNKTTCMLYIPAGSLSAYQAANQWQDFIHIIEMSSMWITDSTILLSSVSNSSMSIFVQTSGTWTTSSSVPWLSFKSTSGTGYDSVKIKALANPNDSIRKATITITTDSSSKTITITQAARIATGFTNIKNENLTLFPNPATNSFSINNEGLSKVEIYSINGKLVVSTTVMDKEAVSVSKLSAGIYIVKIITDGSVVTKRLIIE